ncbi:hypothetical protein FBU30_005540 [Linnemannia zychae]|nr:hypothetical protein FBU30_005540 [Linnemannia zychae]
MPSFSRAKLDQIQPSTDGSDALSSLWKKSVPIQEPYFQTRHTIASQHTLSTLDGVLFSLDEDPKEFNEGMFIAMRNRIFELEAKTVNYAPFNRTRKRSIDRSMDDYYGYGRPPYGYDGEPGHSAKRAAYYHPYAPRSEERHYVYRHAPSYPSWYTPETYVSGSQHRHPGHRHLPPGTGNRETAPSHVQADSRGSRNSGGQDSEAPASSPPRNLAAKPQATVPRPILPHRGNESSSSSSSSQSNQNSLPSHPSSQYASSGASPVEQPPVPTVLTQQQQQQQQHSVKIQRQYQPHQQMYSSSSVASAQSQFTLQQQQQHQASRLMAIQHHQQQQQSAQQQLIQRYQAQRLLQQKQLQVKQLQELRQRANMAQSLTNGATLTAMKAQSLSRVNGNTMTTNTIENNGPRQKSARPLECSNCMALDSLTWRPRIESSSTSASNDADISSTDANSGSSSNGSTSNSPSEGRLLCPTCIQYWQTHRKCRPVPPFRVNFLKKIHSRFKKELQEIRFQGWQDAQVLEVEDRMTERDWQRVFCAVGSIDDAAATAARSRQTSISSTTTSSPVTHSIKASTPVTGAEDGPIVIKIEDDDDEVAMASQQSLFPSATSTSLPPSEVRTFMSEAAVGEVFGQRWKTEPMVGYTLVHFGGSDRTRMVPMNPTVPSLTVTFSRVTESVVFAFRVLVNGLCLMSSGGGPPALHMPEMEEDEEESDEECEQDMATNRGGEESEDVEMENASQQENSASSPSARLSTLSLMPGAAIRADNSAVAEMMVPET